MVMRRRFSRSRFPRRRRVKPDLLHWSMCRTPFTLDGGTCQVPVFDWISLLSVQKDTGTTQNRAAGLSRGVSFLGARFRYSYNAVRPSFSQLPGPDVQFITTFRTFLLVHPIDQSGAPLLTAGGLLPDLVGTQLADISPTEILWSGLDHIVIDSQTSANEPEQTQNVCNRYLPIERVKTKRFLDEGKGLFFAVYGIQPTTDTTLINYGLDLQGVMAIKHRF